MAEKKYRETKTQRKQSQVVNGITGGLLGSWAGAATAEQGLRRRQMYTPVRFQRDPHNPFGGRMVAGEPEEIRRPGFARRWQESAAKKTQERPNPKFNTKRWEKISNLENRAGTAGEKSAASAAKERMLGRGEGPTLKGSRNPFTRAIAHKHSPKVTATLAGLAVAAPTAGAAYSVGRAMDKHINHPQANRIEAERKHNMSKSAFGVDHEEVAKYWNPENKTQSENVKHGAKKGAAVGAGIGGGLGALGGATVAGPVGALAGGAEGGIKGALVGAGIGAGHGALRTNKDKKKLKKSLELKPLVFNSNGQIVGDAVGNGEQRNPGSGPFGVPKGPLVALKQKKTAKGKTSTTTGKSGNVAKAFDPMSEEEIEELLKGFGMAPIKSAASAVRGFTQYHGAGAANKIAGGYQKAKPKMANGLKLAAANPGKTALATAGVGGGAGFGIGRKTK